MCLALSFVYLALAAVFMGVFERKARDKATLSLS
jgi:hypothetical protein